jgi:hypothetical protein
MELNEHEKRLNKWAMTHFRMKLLGPSRRKVKPLSVWSSLLRFAWFWLGWGLSELVDSDLKFDL